MLAAELRKNWKRSRVLILPFEEWDCLISDNGSPEFDVITYSYNSKLSKRNLTGLQNKSVMHIPLETEFWGQSIFQLAQAIVGKYEVYGFLNGDIWTTIEDINKCFNIGDLYNLDLFQPSLSLSSYFSHQHTLNQPGHTLIEVPFVEIMIPFLSQALLKAYVDYGYWNYSGWGIDCYLWPVLAKLLNLKPPTIVHASLATHCKPVDSAAMRFSNGLTAQQELEQMHAILSNNQQ